MMWRGESEICELFERDETDDKMKVIHLSALCRKHQERSVTKDTNMSWYKEAWPFLN